MRCIRSLAGPLILALAGRAVIAQEWARFRGPNGTGVSADTTIPTVWTEADFAWKVDLPGRGHSQPIVWGERIFLTCASEDGVERQTVCLALRDGSKLWSAKGSVEAKIPKHDRNSYATSTPAADEARVYVAQTSPRALLLQSFDHDGKEKWVQDLGPYENQHSGGASPMLFEDLVILPNEQDGKSNIVAFARASGEIRWKRERKSAKASFATPCVIRGQTGADELICLSEAHGVSSLDPRTGEPLWEARVFDKRTVSSPIFFDGLIFGTCGSGGGGNFAVAVRLGGKGDVTATHLAYKLQKSIPYVPTPIIRNGLLFLWSDQGVVSCAETSRGSVLWQARVGGNFSGSPVCVGDRLYCMSEDGEVPVVAAAREYKLLSRNPLGEGSLSTPCISGGRMLLRTKTKLICVMGAARRASPQPSE